MARISKRQTQAGAHRTRRNILLWWLNIHRNLVRIQSYGKWNGSVATRCELKQQQQLRNMPTSTPQQLMEMVAANARQSLCQDLSPSRVQIIGSCFHTRKIKSAHIEQNTRNEMSWRIKPARTNYVDDSPVIGSSLTDNQRECSHVSQCDQA